MDNNEKIKIKNISKHEFSQNKRITNVENAENKQLNQKKKIIQRKKIKKCFSSFSGSNNTEKIKTTNFSVILFKNLCKKISKNNKIINNISMDNNDEICKSEPNLSNNIEREKNKKKLVYTDSIENYTNKSKFTSKKSFLKEFNK